MKEVDFAIDVWDFNSSMAYSIHYHIDNDSLIIKKDSGIEGEESLVIIGKKISEKEFIDLKKEVALLPLRELKNNYINPLTEDGDQKSINILIDNYRKEIEVSNVYVPEISKLFNSINKLLEDQHKISYSKE